LDIFKRLLRIKILKYFFGIHSGFVFEIDIFCRTSFPELSQSGRLNQPLLLPQKTIGGLSEKRV